MTQMDAPLLRDLRDFVVKQAGLRETHVRLLFRADSSGFAFAPDGEVAIKAAAGDGEKEKIPTANIVAYTGGIMRPAWPPVTLVLDLAGAKAEPGDCPLIRDHDPSQVLGQGPISIEAKRVTVAASLCGPAKYVDEVVEAAQKGFKWRASLEGSLENLEFVDKGDSAEANGRTFRGPLYIARKSNLVSCSIVSLAGDQRTSTKIAAQQGAAAREVTIMFEQWLKARGITDSSKLDENVLKTLRAAWEAEMRANGQDPTEENDPPADPPANPEPAPAKPTLVKAGKKKAPKAPTKPATDPDPEEDPEPVEDPLIAERRRLAAERRRIAKIEKLGDEYKCDDSETIVAKAIEEGWSEVQAERDLLRASRPKIPLGRGNSSVAPVSDTQALTAGLCLTYNVGREKALLKAFGEKALNDGDKLRKLGFRRTVEAMAAARGVQLPMDVGSSEYLRAAFSGTDLSGILGNVANVAFTDKFNSMPSVVDQITAARSHTNFQIHTVYSLNLAGDLEDVAPTGELKHLSVGEESYTRQVGTKGALLKITRQDLVNDSLGAFVDNAQRLGLKSAHSREKAVFKTLNATGAGASFFTTAHANYYADAASVLSFAALSVAVKMFRDQVGPSGDGIVIEPKILLVPSDLEVTAREIVNPNSVAIAVALASTSAKQKESNANVWAGAFNVVVSSLLKTTIKGVAGSTTAWYLLADPAYAAAIEVAYLNGNTAPVIEYFGLDHDVSTLGVCWRCYYDFGVALAEYRAGFKSKGAAA